MYEKYYNLQGNPFRLSPDPRFLYGSPGHARALAYLRYGIQMGDGFIVITGGVGTGKTTLIKSLMNEVLSQNIVAAHLVTAQLEPDQLLGMIAASFGLANQNGPKAALLHNLETFMVARAREGKRLLLLLDEAHHIPAEALEELRMLSNYQVNEKAIMQSFLVGQPVFKTTLQSSHMEQFRQRVIAAHHLEPLDERNTRCYIQHRLALVGWADDPHLTEDAYRAIYQQTGGVPREINLICDRSLLHASLEKTHEIDGATVDLIAQERRDEMSVPGAKGEGDITEPEVGTELSPLLLETPAEPLVGITAGLGHQDLAKPDLSNTVSDAERRLIALERRMDAMEKRVDENYQRLKKLIILATLPEKEARLPEIYNFIEEVEKM